jgi:hypothetical protein
MPENLQPAKGFAVNLCAWLNFVKQAFSRKYAQRKVVFLHIQTKLLTYGYCS